MPRVLVLIVVSGAARHLEGLLERLAGRCAAGEGLHLLVIDDASSDGAAGTAARWLEDRGVADAAVLRNPVGQGHGGNQKLGYRYALDAGFDLVVPLPEGGEPELVAVLVEAFERTGAGVVLGSLPRPPSTAARLLGAAQGWIAGRRLAGYPTGYRAYSAEFLRSVPFEIATDDRHFETEILLQALTVGAAIEEVEVAARGAGALPGGARHAVAALASTVNYRLHHLGMLCSLKYRDLRAARYRSKSWIPYSSHARALDLVRRAAPRTLLDLGCGPGHVAKRCEEMGVRVTGVDREEPLPDTMSDFRLWDLEDAPLPVDALAFDVVLMLDVIEHLADPEGFLLALRNASEQATAEPATRVVLTTPNVAFATLRLNLLLGRFNYAERGILDVTHKRLFTRRSLLSMLESCGFRRERIEGIGVPFEAVVGGRLGRVLGSVSSVLARLWPGLFAFQLLVVCRPLPGVRQLLGATEPYLRGEGIGGSATGSRPAISRGSRGT